MPPTKKAPPKRSATVKADKKGSKLTPELNITRREINHPIFQRLAEHQMPKIISDAVASKKHLDKLEAAKKEAMASFNADIKEAKQEFDGHMTLMEKGETIYVKCEELKDFEAQTVTIYRVDTREQVEKRDMTDEDHQLRLNERADNAESHEDQPKGKGKKKDDQVASDQEEVQHAPSTPALGASTGHQGFTDWPSPEEARGNEEIPALSPDEIA